MEISFEQAYGKELAKVMTQLQDLQNAVLAYVQYADSHEVGDHKECRMISDLIDCDIEKNLLNVLKAQGVINDENN